jgi:hypothetical protein
MPPGTRQIPSSDGTAVCRECRAEVPVDALTCPHCEAPRPARNLFSGEGYEWKSAALWMRYPVVHIAFGLDATGRPRTAQGLIAIGQRAVGGVAIGILAGGFLAIGLVSIGVFSLGIVAVALVGACGVNAIAPYACGVVALGYATAALAGLRWK